MNLNFRLLRADEIDARISQITKNNVMLLLYKDARCDMNILDETVGATNWQRHHNRDNANCIVSIYDKEKGCWIEKEDVGTESNTEAEKGLASDSFKRSCVNWGIGRELYTAPNLFFPKENTGTFKGTDGKEKCFDRFVVDEIQYEGRNISYVKITDVNTKKSMVACKTNTAKATVAKGAPVSSENVANTAPDPVSEENTQEKKRTAFMDKIKANFEGKDKCNEIYFKVLDALGVKTTKDITDIQWNTAMEMVDVFKLEDKKKSAQEGVA